MIPVSKATWYAGVQSGRFPKSISLGPNIVAWRMDEILRLMENGVAT
jgi:predicted DNA-binding transcriptional regulator AlpA